MKASKRGERLREEREKGEEKERVKERKQGAQLLCSSATNKLHNHLR